MYTVLLILFVIISLALMLIVLVQSSKGGGLGGAFGGGGGGQAVFGGRGAAPFLAKLTNYLAASYFVFALLLSIASARGRSEDSEFQEELSGMAGQLTSPGVPVSSALEILSSDSVSAVEEGGETADSGAAESE